ncbi:hypothetical protein GW17_00001092 [Ensete ventricosum]|nr:hypothetical protein GW17_00001092 [Ensete ventricosum]
MATNCRLTSGGLFLFGTCPLISPRRANGEMTAGYNGAVWARNRMATLEKRDGRGSGAHGDYDAICRLRHGKCWSPRLPDSHEPITSLVDRNVDTSIIYISQADSSAACLPHCSTPVSSDPMLLCR